MITYYYINDYAIFLSEIIARDSLFSPALSFNINANAMFGLVRDTNVHPADY